MKRFIARSIVMGTVVASLFGAQIAQATTMLTFSDFSSDSTPISALEAEVSFTVSGSQLLIDINNTSAYKIAQLYFNTDTTLTGLSFASIVNPAWSISGTGTSQALGADGMGNYNWLIDFGSGNDRLGAGTTGLTLDMTGTTTEATIGSKLSTIPPGSTQAYAAVKFEAGPSGDSAFGGSITNTPPPPPNPVPEPSTVMLFSTGLGILGYGWRRRQAAQS